MSDAFERYSGLKIFQSPQCLLKTDDDMHLSIVEEIAEELRQITLPVNVVAIVGLYRTGKSYLMNVLAGETSGFTLGSAIQSKTKGIWAWCKKHPTQKGQVLLLLDTEGLGDVEKGSPDHDNKIFIIAALLSSTLVYNVMSAFNQDTVEKLTFITNMTENLKLSVRDTSDDNFDFIMPEFILCIRDFILDLVIDGKKTTPDGYLEHTLRDKRTGNKESDEKYNRPRHCIKKYFTKRKAFTFERPASSSRLMRNLDKVKEDDLLPEFIEESQNFKRYIYERPGKMLETKRPVTVCMLVELLFAYLTAMKNGKVPCIDDALTVMSRKENEKHAKDAIDTFRVDLGNLNRPVGNKSKLLEKKFEIQTLVLKNLNQKLLFDDDNSVEMSVQSEMNRIFKEFEAENDRLLYEKCMKRITDIYEEKVKGNIDKGIYMVSGGYEKYKNDMHNVKEMYETELDHEGIDRMQTNKAMRDFLAERHAEREAIMTKDKSISEEEKKAEMEKEKKKNEKDFKETQEKEKKRFADELEKQRKQHDEEMTKARKEQADRDEENRKQFFEEKLARREAEFLDLTRSVARLEGREEERNNRSCSVS